MHGLRQLSLHIEGILGHADMVNSYFLISGGEALLVDAGRNLEADSAAICEQWRQLGEPRMQGILLTHGHPDHIGAAPRLREQWQAPILMHPGDADILERLGNPFTPDVVLADGTELDTPLGLARVLHTPGHSPGHVCLFFEGSGLLLSGDQVITNGTVYVGEPFGNMTDHLASMRLLLELPVKTLAPGHGPIIDDGWDHILEMHEYRLRREGEILMGLRSGCATAMDVARVLYRDRGLSEEVLEFGARQTECHLEHLEGQGVVTKTAAGNWELAPS